MANSLAEESYAFNLEWIAAGSGIGEEICGVDKDCIVVPGSPGLHKDLDGVVGEHLQEVEDYVEIQVTEEEVVTDQWQTQHDGSEEDPIGLRIEGGTDELIVPLPEVQDEYSRLHPYPCDFCSRRFSKKSALTAHMVSHQVERTHGCNMCGEQYRRKHDLVEHMKQHAYAPERSLEEDIDDFATLTQAKPKVKRKKSRARSPEDVKPPRKPKRSPIAQPSTHLNNTFHEEIVAAPLEPQHSTRFPIIDPNRPYVCQDCGVGFAREKALNSHMMIHAGDSAFECERCHDMFQTSEQLREHDVTRHGRVYPRSVRTQDGGTFQCDHCSASFHWYNQLKKHQRDHPKCGEESNGENLMCPLCNIVYETPEQLQIHKEDHDTEIGVHSCDICGEVYEHLDELKEHVRLRHKLTHTCHFCDSVFKDAKSLSKHSLSHIEERSYPCNICGARFHNKGKLRKHLTMHEDEKRGVSCSECGLNLPDGRSLVAHMQSIHGANMSRLFPCTQCGKTFSSRSSQQIHVRVHTGEKPYGCRFCWKAFADGGTLRKHERIHTGEKPYVCPVCSKAFNQRVVLREHVRAHHSGAESRLSSNCYECIVCGKMFGTSRELCLHLVHHSDENTAKHRLPNTSPRKYVGRRKKYPPYFSQPFPKQEPCSDASESSRDSTDFKEKKKIPSTSKRIDNNFQENERESFEAPVKLGDHSLDDLIDKPGVKRARIVRSGKKGYPKGNNKRFIKGKGKAARLMNNTSYASKYVVTRTEGDSPGMQNLLEAVGVSGSEEIINGDLPPPRSRPRTKNVSYHNMKAESKFELATFPSLDSETKNRKSRKVSKTKVKKEEQPIDTQFVNGIDPSLFEDENHCGEQIETCIVDDIGVELKLEVKTTEPEDFPTVTDNIVIKTELVACEMCSEVFTNRSDLLKHIQVHI